MWAISPAHHTAKTMPNSTNFFRPRLFVQKVPIFWWIIATDRIRLFGHAVTGAVRFAPPTGAIRSTQPLEGSARLGHANRAAGHQPPHPCRPSSVLTSTYIGTNAEPVLSLLYLFLLLSTYGVPLAAPWSPRWLIRPSSAPKNSPAKGFSTPATTPASPSRSRPSRSRHRCRIRPPEQPRSPPPCKIRSPRCSAC